ncbi:hypothetical protein R1sor_019405 [Riccia sorocarpa]|uniref:Myb/SANT-like DNA-binding domain-containing protein n=1 Tax=Riccia sorocarpa TaxID=122646 RepID=A0ABD3ICG3_9MARC
MAEREGVEDNMDSNSVLDSKKVFAVDSAAVSTPTKPQNVEEVPSQQPMPAAQNIKSQASGSEVVQAERAPARQDSHAARRKSSKTPAGRKKNSSATSSRAPPAAQPSVEGTQQPRNSNAEEDDDDSSDEDSGGQHGTRWLDWQVKVLLEAKREEYQSLDGASSRDVILNASYKFKWKKIAEKLVSHNIHFSYKRCRTKWNRTVREYRRIHDFQINVTGAPAYASMDVEARAREKLPVKFEQEWIDILDTFLGDRPCQRPPGGNIDDSESARPEESQMNGKRKRNVGENTKYLVAGMTAAMKESTEALVNIIKKSEDKRLAAEKEATQIMSANCDKICDVLRVLASAVVSMNSRQSS